MNPSIELKVLQIDHTTKVMSHAIIDYLFKIHGLLLTQNMLSKEILIRLGAEPEEVNMMLEEMSKESRRLGKSISLEIMASADRSANRNEI